MLTPDCVANKRLTGSLNTVDAEEVVVWIEIEGAIEVIVVDVAVFVVVLALVWAFDADNVSDCLVEAET